MNFITAVKYHYKCYSVRRKSIFEYKELSQDYKLYSGYLYKENSFYGNFRAFNNALRNNKIPFFLIEHGYYFGNYVPGYTFFFDNIEIVTFSNQRLRHIGNALNNSELNIEKINVITIGPYINYADSVIDQSDMKKIKADCGKILLVFPSHSIEGVIYKYNTQDFINEIEKVSKDFDSVFVCMYWKDIQDGRYVEYEKKGYKIVTAGHRNDPNFLGRLKDIIDLSDMTMSNTVGTHVGYCVARNKPHYLFNQFQEVEGEKADEEFKERKNLEYLRTRDEEVNEVIGAFSKLSYIITEEQKYVVEKYWGKNEVKYYTISKKGIKNDKKNL